MKVRPKAVIDVNILRKKTVVENLQQRFRSNGEQIVFADALWSELIANANWESTLLASLKYLATVPEAVVASWSVGAMLLSEYQTGVRARGIVHPLMTPFFRQLLAEVAGGGSSFIERLREPIGDPAAGKNDLAARRKDATQQLAAMGQRSIPPARRTSINNCSRDGDRGPFVDLVADLFDPKEVAAALVRQDVSVSIADVLTSAPTLTSVRNLFLTHMGLEWTIVQGVQGATPARIYNDFVDIEYSLTAWACDGTYVTGDRRASRRHKEVTELCSRIWPGSTS